MNTNHIHILILILIRKLIQKHTIANKNIQQFQKIYNLVRNKNKNQNQNENENKIG